MADTFPQSHTTTTTTRVGITTTTNPAIHLEELTSFNGILKYVEIVLALITFICAASSYCSWYSNVGWASFVSLTGFFIAIASLMILLFHLRQKMPSNVPMVLIELIVYGIWTFFFLVAGSTLAATSGNYWHCRGATGAGSFFAFATMLAFGFDAFLMFKEWQSRDTLPTSRPSGPAGTVINP